MQTYFRLYEDLNRARRLDRAFNAANKVFTVPTSANPLIEGEWFEIDNSVTTEQYKRGTGALPSVPLFLEKGRPEMQITGKGTFLFGYDWIADTKVMVTTSLDEGLMLKVGNVTIDSLARSGLVYHDGTGTDWVVGYVMRLPANNGGWLRFQRLSPFRLS